MFDNKVVILNIMQNYSGYVGGAGRSRYVNYLVTKSIELHISNLTSPASDKAMEDVWPQAIMLIFLLPKITVNQIMSIYDYQ